MSTQKNTIHYFNYLHISFYILDISRIGHLARNMCLLKTMVSQNCRLKNIVYDITQSNIGLKTITDIIGDH